MIFRRTPAKRLAGCVGGLGLHAGQPQHCARLEILLALVSGRDRSVVTKGARMGAATPTRNRGSAGARAAGCWGPLGCPAVGAQRRHVPTVSPPGCSRCAVVPKSASSSSWPFLWGPEAAGSLRSPE
jgi:hypothetical protein